MVVCFCVSLCVLSSAYRGKKGLHVQIRHPNLHDGYHNLCTMGSTSRMTVSKHAVDYKGSRRML